MTSLYKPITLILEFYYMSNGITFEYIEYNFAKLLLMLGHNLEMSCAKFQRNRFRINGEIDEKYVGDGLHMATMQPPPPHIST